MNTDQEAWARINGFENEPYEISTLGNVRRLPHITISSVGARIAYGGASVRTSVHRPSGGLTFNVYSPDPDTGKKKAIHLWVHRAVAMTFIPNPEKRYTVNHKDGNRSNNRVDNLEWATYSENHLHAYNILKRKHSTGKRKPYNWLSGTQLGELLVLGATTPVRALAAKYQISPRHVARLLVKHGVRMNVEEERRLRQ